MLSRRAVGIVAGESPSIYSLGYKDVTGNMFMMFISEQSSPLGFAAPSHCQRSMRWWLQQARIQHDAVEGAHVVSWWLFFICVRPRETLDRYKHTPRAFVTLTYFTISAHLLPFFFSP